MAQAQITVEYKPNNFGEIFYFQGIISKETEKAVYLEFSDKKGLWIPKSVIQKIAENQYQFKYLFKFDKKFADIIKNNIINAG